MRKPDSVHVMLSVMGIGAVLISFTSGVVAGFFYLVMSVGSWVSINAMMDLLYSVFTERVYRRDRLLSEYVPARAGNWWLTVGLVALYVWGAYGFAAAVSSAPGVLMWVWLLPGLLPGLVVGSVVPWVRARRDAKDFRGQVVAARDESLDRQFWGIVNNEKEA